MKLIYQQDKTFDRSCNGQGTNNTSDKKHFRKTLSSHDIKSKDHKIGLAKIAVRSCGTHFNSGH